MSQGLDDGDADALSALANAPPSTAGTRKTHSQQLRTNTGANFKRHPKHNHRKHSLDDARISAAIDGFRNHSSEDDDHDFYPYATSSSFTESSHSDPNSQHYLFHGNNNSNSHNNNSNSSSSFDEQYPLPEFLASGGGAGIFKSPSRSVVHQSTTTTGRLPPPAPPL